MKKRQLLIHIDPNTDNEFRTLIQQKYNKFEKGILSQEAEQALQYWIHAHTKTHKIDTPPTKITPKIQLTFQEIKNFLFTGFYDELESGQKIPTIHLKRAIENIRGGDPRTVSKWMRLFHENGLIKPASSATWEIT